MFSNPGASAAWKKLAECAQSAQSDGETRAYSLNGLYIDFSRQRLNKDIVSHLLDLARAQKIEEWRERMFAGDSVNTTEQRAVLHTALRRPASDAITIEGENIMPPIHDSLNRMKQFSDAVRSGTWTGYTGKPIRSIVNLGIGGSDLGPHMVCEALSAFSQKKLSFHFVSNVDGAHLSRALEKCDPETTLFLIASKTFTTQETMANAASTRAWLLSSLKDEAAIARHFVALSTNKPAVEAFGIDAANMFPFRDWVGGRYSLWSSIGLPICLSIGFDGFEKLLAGAYAMDRHFQSTPLEANLPVLMALTGIWNRNFLNTTALAILPYDQNLALFPSYLQQLEMESNGKSVDRDGNPITYKTAPLIFGDAGTNGQHSFYQWLHQGTDIVPCDFIAAKDSNYPLGDHHKVLLTHMLAQGQAFDQGRTLQQAKDNPHRVFDGNRPSTAILLDRLDPYHLGMLIALYEHKVFVQGIIWNINSFDQYGVELGKELAKSIETGDDATLDSVTTRLKTLLTL